jgi:hypothetical protein
MPCPFPEHHRPSGGGSGAIAAAAALLALVVVASIAGPVVHAAVELVRVVLITAGVLLGLGLAGGLAIVAWRRRQDRQAAPRVVGVVTPGLPKPAGALPAPRRPRIGAPGEVHLHFHGMTAEEAAAIVRQAHPVYGTEHPPAIEEDRGTGRRPRVAAEIQEWRERG